MDSLMTSSGCCCGPSSSAAIWSCCFRSSSTCSVMGDLSGWWKAVWIIFLIFAPFLSVLIYVIARAEEWRNVIRLRRVHGKRILCAAAHHPHVCSS